jgi:SNF2 family DNA or RNA helicase
MVFGERYGNPVYNFFKKSYDFKGSSNEKEINHILSYHMIRRLKKEVLKDLPDKVRTRMKIAIDDKTK